MDTRLAGSVVITRITRPCSTCGGAGAVEDTYDAQGRMLTRTGPDGAVTTYVQGAWGPTSITQSVTLTTDRTTSIAYHAALGRPETITDPRGKVTTMASDVTNGNLTCVTDALGHATTFGYDALGRRTAFTTTSAGSTPAWKRRFSTRCST